MKKRVSPRSEEGWTFVETIIVIAIVMVLTSSVGFVAIGYLDKARAVAARSQIDSFCVALEAYYIDRGEYPDRDSGLGSLWDSGKGSGRPGGPYLYRPVPHDPWGNPYQYRTPGKGGAAFGIVSYGSDGKEGGDGYAADLSSDE